MTCQKRVNPPRPYANGRAMVSAVAAGAACLCGSHAVAAEPTIQWSTVVNNNVSAPGAPTKNFFSYNQPSISDAGLVVFRARARAEGGGSGGGGSQPLRGIWTRDMSVAGSPLNTIATVDSLVPQPNNLDATFNEFPSFPRIDAASNTVAFRGQTQPVLSYTTPTGDTKGGTSGVYTNPTGTLITGASLLGHVTSPDLSYFQVPNAPVAGTRFDQFPGAPTASGNIVAFKGNWTDPSLGGQTGIYYRDTVANGGTSPVQYIAGSGMTIPGAGGAVFGSTSPPSAANGKLVFLGLDNEANPTAGGIYLAPLSPSPSLTTLVSLGAGGTQVAGTASGTTFRSIGEGLSYDGRYVAFTGGWGSEMRTVEVNCPADGNAVAACNEQDNGLTPGSGAAGDGKFSFEVLAHQGVFVYDTVTGGLDMKAQTGVDGFLDFTFWNFSGAPATAGSEEETGAEPPRWRTATFAAVSGGDVVFKALRDTGVNGLYGNFDGEVFTIAETGMDGSLLDPDAAGMPILSLGIERDGFRNGRIAINASMANADADMAGIYVGAVPEPSTYALMALGLAAIGFTTSRRRRNGAR